MQLSHRGARAEVLLVLLMLLATALEALLNVVLEMLTEGVLEDDTGSYRPVACGTARAPASLLQFDLNHPMARHSRTRSSEVSHRSHTTPTLMDLPFSVAVSTHNKSMH